MSENEQCAPVLLSDIIEAVEFVSASSFDEHHAYICRRTGRTHLVSEFLDLDDDAEALPDDPEECGYIAVPHRRDLDLGKPLALAFVAEELPELLDRAQEIFRRKGAFRRFKDLIGAQGKLDSWYAYEERAMQQAVRNWCEALGIPLAGETQAAVHGETAEPSLHVMPCDACGGCVPTLEMTQFGSRETGYRDLCSRCYNEEVARLGGLTFEHVAFEPVDLFDGRGRRHRFHFVLRHLGSMVMLGGYEVRADERTGYEFEVHGGPEADPFELMQRLHKRMRRELAITYLAETEFGLGIAETKVGGQITCDPEAADRLPVLVIDGQEVDWDQFGRMLMTFEGWRFHLEIQETSEEV